MPTAFRFLSFAALTFGTLTVAAGCSKKTVDTVDSGVGGAPALSPEDEHVGLRACCELGALCHPVDDLDERAAECHDIGHEGDPVVCLNEFVSCATLCRELATRVDGGVVPVAHACVDDSDGGESHMDDHDHAAGGAHTE